MNHSWPWELTEAFSQNYRSYCSHTSDKLCMFAYLLGIVVSQVTQRYTAGFAVVVDTSITGGQVQEKLTHQRAHLPETYKKNNVKYTSKHALKTYVGINMVFLP